MKIPGCEVFGFKFNVGASFLDERHHPITVPREQVDYQALEASGLNRRHLHVIFSRGESHDDQYYTLYPKDETESGMAGRGPYHQLQMRGDFRTIPAYLKLDDHLVILIYKVGSKSFVTMEYRD